MMKSLSAMTHRADLSREFFQNYYEETHAPLAIQLFPFSRYVRNHLLDAPDIGFDTISEFWAEDITAVAALMDGPVGEISDKDEKRFMDQSRIAIAGAEEHVLSSGPAGNERFAVLVDWSGERKVCVLEWARHVAARAAGVSIDFTRAWQRPVFPARAVLWTPDSASLGDIPAELSAQVVRVRRCETPPEVLAAACGRHPG